MSNQAQPYFQHPRRFPGNAPGPFYTTGQAYGDEVCFDGMIGDCLQCEAPEHEAPELLAILDENNLNTYFIRQPETQEEVEHACNAARVCCVAALRYGGQERAIIRKLGNSPEYCDYIIDINDNLRLTIDSAGNLLPFAQTIVDGIPHSYYRRHWRDRS